MSRRSELHAGSARRFSEGYDDVGEAGEDAFGALIGQERDKRDLPGGDGGVDFTVTIDGKQYTVDVKTARKAFYLLVEAGRSDKPMADLYVLCSYSDAMGCATCLGWATRAEVIAAPTKDFGFGVVSHYIARERLRPIVRLVDAVRNGTWGS